MRRILAAALVTLAGCAFEPAGPGDPGPGDPTDPNDPTGPLDDDDDIPPTTPPAITACRVDGPNLGVVGLTVEVQSQGTYRFESWQLAAGGELVGFTLSGPTTARYEVRAGDDRFWSEGLIWTNPDDEPDSITRIDFCATGDGGDD